MKNVFALWLGVLILTGCSLCASCAHAGFNLIVDEASLRRVDYYSEVDVLIETVPEANLTIYSLLLNLRIFPGAGQPLNAIDGVQFLGLRNPDGSPLFSNPEVSFQISAPHFMPGSLINPVEVSAPATVTTAFTVQFVNYNSVDVDIQLGFFDIGNFYQRRRLEDPQLRQFDNLVQSGNLSVQPIPEPSTLILAGIGLVGGVASGWRRTHRSPRRP